METSMGLQAILVGIGATLIMDVWGWLQKNIFNSPPLNYALIARWLAFMPKGQFVHRPIMATPSIRGEKPLGWVLHYVIGIVFALTHVFIWGKGWLTEPSVIPAMFTGIVTLVFPFCLIQPCLGFGVAASQTPRPWKARWLSFLAHSAYGIGLFGSALSLHIGSVIL
ncbi:DUF2938 domain-containing protein [Vibrio gazogenes]|uniref:DUF2938 domain-containing protein n=1 Tax=Vibrio gazogenes DSM 21264 = NBRC 103151 TaxID=1123492 RepID=A0A1M4UN49_VIBGA|nr:DUF2938 domain-containing protein [Vibrio gazogenes]USP15727.1 DUF2938 domain-containing protein [Vibrio gazogenes]SHE58146.1 Protein of unknown function [Vibrio gazogenes DSM 21264] [Vibrio gazogenes DSM 21264 = NBRC 103151]SJN59399.1 hypothetical protein BQ6471_03448 [Vibrio gazogenes]